MLVFTLVPAIWLLARAEVEKARQMREVSALRESSTWVMRALSSRALVARLERDCQETAAPCVLYSPDAWDGLAGDPDGQRGRADRMVVWCEPQLSVGIVPRASGFYARDGIISEGVPLLDDCAVP